PSSSRGGRRPTWRSIRTWGLHRRGRPRRSAPPYGLPRSLRSLAVTGERVVLMNMSFPGGSSPISHRAAGLAARNDGGWAGAALPPVVTRWTAPSRSATAQRGRGSGRRFLRGGRSRLRLLCGAYFLVLEGDGLEVGRRDDLQEFQVVGAGDLPVLEPR